MPRYNSLYTTLTMGTLHSIPLRTTLHYPVLIIGAGPVGIGVAYELKKHNILFHIVDTGKHHRDRDRYDTHAALHGFCGAAGFSDGKYASPPAGSSLYKLVGDRVILREGYAEHKRILAKFNIMLAELPDDAYLQGFDTTYAGFTSWSLKRYPCEDSTLDTRMRLYDYYMSKIGVENISFESRVTTIEKTETGYKVCITEKNGEIRYITCEKLVIGTGRYGCMNFESDPFPKRMRRVEFGFRIAGPSDDPFFTRPEGCFDPKFMIVTDFGQVRVFCFVVNGETVITRSSFGMYTYSGRADCPVPTGESNFGFNVRCRNGAHILHKLRERNQTFEFTLKEFLDNPDILLPWGEEYARMMHEQVSSYVKFRTPGDLENMKIRGPTVEGVGDYYSLDPATLTIVDHPDVYIGGDATGIFRGSVPSGVSGHVIGKMIANSFIAQRELLV